MSAGRLSLRTPCYGQTRRCPSPGLGVKLQCLPSVDSDHLAEARLGIRDDGCAAGEGLESREPECLDRTGCEHDIHAGKRRCQVSAIRNITEERHGQATRRLLHPVSERAITGHDEMD